MNNFHVFNPCLQLQVANLPINLILSLDETITFVRTRNDKTLIDSPESGVGAVFTDEGFFIGDDERIGYDYNTPYPYKDIELMKQWLQAQKLIMPEMA